MLALHALSTWAASQGSRSLIFFSLDARMRAIEGNIRSNAMIPLLSWFLDQGFRISLQREHQQTFVAEDWTLKRRPISITLRFTRPKKSDLWLIQFVWNDAGWQFLTTEFDTFFCTLDGCTWECSQDDLRRDVVWPGYM